MNLYLASASSEYEAPLVRAALPFVPPGKRDRIERCRSAQQRTCMALAEVVLAWALRGERGIVPAPEDRLEGEWGKPRYRGEAAAVEFNVSHSGSWVLVGVDDVPIGVDIQIQDRDDERIARKVMPRPLFEKWRNAPDRRARFCDFWARRESELKWWGIGLGGLGRTDLSLPERVSVKNVEAPPGYSAAVCGTMPEGCRDGAIPARVVSLEELLSHARGGQAAP